MSTTATKTRTTSWENIRQGLRDAVEEYRTHVLAGDDSEARELGAAVGLTSTDVDEHLRVAAAYQRTFDDERKYAVKCQAASEELRELEPELQMLEKTLREKRARAMSLRLLVTGGSAAGDERLQMQRNTPTLWGDLDPHCWDLAAEDGTVNVLLGGVRVAARSGRGRPLFLRGDSMNEERRYTTSPSLSATPLVSAGGKGAGRIAGYAARWGDLYYMGDGVTETIVQGAFTDALAAGQDVRLLQDHDSSLLLARTGNGTLELKEDSIGLWFSADLPDTTLAHDVYDLIRRQTLSQCSFAFVAKGDGQRWTQQRDGTTLREIVRVSSLFDVSVVTYPAYASTSVQAGSPGRAAPAKGVTFSAASRLDSDEMFSDDELFDGPVCKTYLEGAPLVRRLMDKAKSSHDREKAALYAKLAMQAGAVAPVTPRTAKELLAHAERAARFGDWLTARTYRAAAILKARN